MRLVVVPHDHRISLSKKQEALLVQKDDLVQLHGDFPILFFSSCQGYLDLLTVDVKATTNVTGYYYCGLLAAWFVDASKQTKQTMAFLLMMEKVFTCSLFAHLEQKQQEGRAMP
jgi:hypothetical protein